VEGEALGPAKTEPVNVIARGRAVMGGGLGGEHSHRRGGGGWGDVGLETEKGNNNRNVNKKYSP